VVVTDEASLPADAIRIRREPDLALLQDLFRKYGEVPGAYLSNAPDTLAIRVK
jgi:hypothetical protein